MQVNPQIQSKFSDESSEQVENLQKMFDIELKICQLLGIQITNTKLWSPKQNKKSLNLIKNLLKIIYNRLLECQTFSQKNPNLDKSSLFEVNEIKQEYQKIQDLLQKEQGKNRCLLRKQFQFKEQQYSIMDQLIDERNNRTKLNEQLNKLIQDLQQKTLEIMHLKNQAKLYQAGCKDIINKETSSILKNGDKISDFAQERWFNQLINEEKKIAHSRQKVNNKASGKKSKTIKENALYALYNSQYKQKFQTINQLNSDKAKKGSMTLRNAGKKGLQKDMNSIDQFNKKSVHSRRKSEQFLKRTPTKARVDNQCRTIKRKVFSSKNQTFEP